MRLPRWGLLIFFILIENVLSWFLVRDLELFSDESYLNLHSIETCRFLLNLIRLIRTFASVQEGSEIGRSSYGEGV